MIMLGSHLCYLTFSILITVLVGQTLYKHGRLFLIDIFAGNIGTADAVNRLLRAGYYLTNIALVSLGIRYGGEADSLQTFVELLSYKVGWVMIILGECISSISSSCSPSAGPTKHQRRWNQ